MIARKSKKQNEILI